MDKFKLRGQNQGRVFNFRCGHACVCHSIMLITKTAQLKVENSAYVTVTFTLIFFSGTFSWRQLELNPCTYIKKSSALPIVLSLLAKNNNVFHRYLTKIDWLVAHTASFCWLVTHVVSATKSVISFHGKTLLCCYCILHAPLNSGEDMNYQLWAVYFS